jgi:Family of unknown function (DUF6297)
VTTPAATAVPDPAASVTAVSVTAIRSFIGRHRRRSWTDWYSAGFALVVAGIYLSDLLARPFSRLSGAAARAAASHAAATQAVAGGGLVIGAGAGLLLLAQAFGPLVLSPADASWLLLSPLRRRGVLRRPARTAALLAVLAGALLGVLALAMAGPFLRPDGGSLPSSWLILAAVAGAGCCLAAVAAEALAQPRPLARRSARVACAAVAVIAALGALAGERWAAVAQRVTAAFAGLTTADFEIAAVAALVLACVACGLLWRALASFPARTLRADSARSGTALTAAGFLNFSLLFWIAEDNHWRGRLLPSRAWPGLPPSLIMAWPDWRRLSRRRGPLALVAVAAVVPALVGAAFTGRAHGDFIAAALVLGAFAAASQATTAIKRDLDNPALLRLLGADPGRTLIARAVLPALLATAWLAIALTVLCAVGVVPGWSWPLLALAGPGVTAGALRLARTAPIDPADRGPDTAMGNTPPWVISRLLSVLVSVIGSWALVSAARAGEVHLGTVLSQAVLSVVVLGVYLFIAASWRR